MTADAIFQTFGLLHFKLQAPGPHAKLAAKWTPHNYSLFHPIASTFNSVVFPAPDGPIRASSRPLALFPETLKRSCFGTSAPRRMNGFFPPSISAGVTSQVSPIGIKSAS